RGWWPPQRTVVRRLLNTDQTRAAATTRGRYRSWRSPPGASVESIHSLMPSDSSWPSACRRSRRHSRSKDQRMILDLLAERLFAKLPAGGRERGVGPVGGLAAGQ